MASLIPRYLRLSALNGVRNSSSMLSSTSSSMLSSTPSVSSKFCFSSSPNLRDEEEFTPREFTPRDNMGGRENFGARMDSRFHNHVTLMGRVTQTPRTVGHESRAVTFFDVVTKRFYESEGEIKDDPHYHTLMVSNLTPGVHDYVKSRVRKGDRVYIEGQLRYVMKETQDGRTKKEPQIHVEDLITVAAGY